jgi:hypothetical protein
MSRKRRYGGKISGPFVPLLKDTLKTPAWRALSYGARSLYVVLKWRYNKNLGNAVYVSTRIAAQELGAGRNQVQPWFHELAHYGFTVMVSPAHHGVNGHGKAPHWRLTEERYLGKEPTRDFLRWDGGLFVSKKPSRIHTIKNRSRGSNAGVSAAPTRVSLVPNSKAQNGTSGSNAGVISGNGTDTCVGAITSQPLGSAKARAVGGSRGDHPNSSLAAAGSSSRLRMRVWIKEIRHPAIKSGPDDNLDDFKIAARMTGFL